MSKQERTFRCVNNQDNFCFVCGEWIAKGKANILNNTLQEIYRQYFGEAAKNYCEQWTPNSICHICRTILYSWASGSTKYVLIDRLNYESKKYVD